MGKTFPIKAVKKKILFIILLFELRAKKTRENIIISIFSLSKIKKFVVEKKKNNHPKIG